MIKRILFALIIIPFLPIIYSNKLIVLFNITIIVMSLMATWEIFDMAKIYTQKNLRTIVVTMVFMVLAYVITVCGIDLFLTRNFSPLYKVITNYRSYSHEFAFVLIFILLATLFAINMIKVDTSSFEERGRAILTSIFIFIYIGLGFWHITLIRYMPSGKYLLTFILLCSWLGDAGGYFVGRKFGKHKMYNSASPNKSYEGFIGMFLFTIPVVLLFDHLSKEGFLIMFMGENIMGYSTIKLIALTILFTFTGFLGDMGESLVKRMYDTKDSSKIFPGHGGVFDIFDSVILTAPIAYYVFVFLS